jgi:gamma-glutamylcyclotransferase (GGCT)/AIG2-like uncharacterized protein YtfP
MKTFYFGYGMNTNIESMTRRCPGAIYMGKATLRNHKLVFKYHADIEAADTNMEGVLWEVGAMEMQSLDYMEGYPVYYSRKEVWVETEKRKYKAWVYFMADDNHEYHAPDEYYLDLLTQGYTDAGIPLSQLLRTGVPPVAPSLVRGIRVPVAGGTADRFTSVSRAAITAREEWIADNNISV